MEVEDNAEGLLERLAEGLFGRNAEEDEALVVLLIFRDPFGVVDR
jgi:hypothetical protein